MRTMRTILGKTMAATALLVFAAACSSEEEMTTSHTNPDREELELSAGSIITVPAEAVTRADGDPIVAPFTNQNFDVIVRSNNGKFVQQTTTAETKTEQTGTDIVVEGVSVNPAKAALNPKLYWDDLGGKEADLLLVGIHPKGTPVSSDVIHWAVEADQSAGINPSDLLLAYKETYTYTDKAVAANLNFQHVAAKVTLNFKKGTNYDGADNFKNPQVVLTNMPQEGDFNILTHAITNNTTPAGITPATPVGTPANGYSCEAIVIPSTVVAGTILATITVDGNTYNVKAPTGGVNIESGKNNVFNVTINKSEVNVSATITDWADKATDVYSQLIQVSTVKITDGQITEGSILLVKLTNGSDTYNISYTATPEATGSSTLEWIITPGTNPLYWDDVKKDASNNPNLTVKALLTVNKDILSITGDNIYTSEITEAITELKTLLEFPSFTHPLSKIIVMLKTTTDDDKVELFPTTGDKPAVTLPLHFGFEINGITVTKNQSAENFQMIDLTNADDIAKGERRYARIVFPQKINSTPTAKFVYISAKVGSNTYEVKTDAPIEYLGKNSYTYTLTIKKSGINASATITEWTLNNAGGGDVTLD